MLKKKMGARSAMNIGIRNVMLLLGVTSLVISTSYSQSPAGTPLGTGFTYQGQLQRAGVPLDGEDLVDLQFLLFASETGGMPVGPQVVVPDVDFDNGVFVVTLDFGAAALDGNERWLLIAVADPPGGPFTPLSPRQSLTGVPYALQMRGVHSTDEEKIGVGTQMPKTKLQVQASHEPKKGQMAVVDKDNDSTSDTAAAALTGWGKDIDTGETGKLWHLGNDEDDEDPMMRKDFKIKNKRDCRIKMGTNDREEDFVIDKDGKVGFGIPNPKSKMELWGKHESKKGQVVIVDSDNPSSSDQAAVAITGWGSDSGIDEFGKLWHVGNDEDANDPMIRKEFTIKNKRNSKLKMGTNGRDKDVVIKEDGKVGIGTDAPKQQLHNNGDYYGKGHFWLHAYEGDGASGTAYLQARDTSGTSSINLRLRTQNAGSLVEAVTVTPGGSVGIGTSTPVSELHVRPAGGSLNAVMTLDSGINGAAKIDFIDVGAPVWTIGKNSGAGGYHFVIDEPGFGTRFLVRAGTGNVGIGRTPAANRLEVEGNASKTAAGSWLANSDARIKADVQSVTDALTTLDKVRLVDFRYTDEYRAAHPTIDDRRYLNVIAQEFAEVFPEHVHSSGETMPDGSEILQVDTYPLTIYSAAAVQELHRIVQQQEAQLSALNARLAKLEAMLNLSISSKNGGVR